MASNKVAPLEGSVPLTSNVTFATKNLYQQGYTLSNNELVELNWALRFTPAVCMVLAAVFVALNSVGPTSPYFWAHFLLAGLGILPFWSPCGHPVDLIYNATLSKCLKTVPVPPGPAPLPRKLACVAGGAFNVFIGISFLFEERIAAWIFAGVLLVLQLIVITTHWCMMSWMWEFGMKILGWWVPPTPIWKVQEMVKGCRYQLVDVRSAAEFATENVPSSINLPEESIAACGVSDLTAKGISSDSQLLVVYCAGGVRANRACRKLKRSNKLHPGVEVVNVATLEQAKKLQHAAILA